MNVQNIVRWVGLCSILPCGNQHPGSRGIKDVSTATTSYLEPPGTFACSWGATGTYAPFESEFAGGGESKIDLVWLLQPKTGAQ